MDRILFRPLGQITAIGQRQWGRLTTYQSQWVVLIPAIR